jgi:hypothetical protein
MIEQCIQQNILTVKEKFVYLQSFHSTPVMSFLPSTPRTQTLPDGFGMVQKAAQARTRPFTTKSREESNGNGAEDGKLNRKEVGHGEKIALVSFEGKSKGKANFHFAPESSPGESPYIMAFPPTLELLPPPSKEMISEDLFEGQGKKRAKKLVRYSNSVDNLVKRSQSSSHIKGGSSTLFSIDLPSQDSSEDDYDD